MSKYSVLGLISAVTVLLSIIYSCQSETELTYARYYTNGKKLYDQHCQNCHGSNGQGLGKLIPPLTDTLFLKKHKSEIVCWIRHGIKDTMRVHQVTYASEMPANASIPEIDIAAIVTYITNNFGNTHGLYDVNNASSDLKQCIIRK